MIALALQIGQTMDDSPYPTIIYGLTALWLVLRLYGRRRK